MSVHEKLKRVCDEVSSWTAYRGLRYDIVCDEDDAQGLMLFKRDRKFVNELLEDLSESGSLEGVHVETHVVRAGTVLLFSLEAMSEERVEDILYTYDRDPLVNNDYVKRIEAAFRGPLTVVAEKPEPPTQPSIRELLFTSAKAIREAQRKSPVNSRSRSQSTNQFRSSVSKGNGDGARITDPNHTGDTGNATQTPNQAVSNPKNSSKGLTRREFLEHKIDEALDGLGSEFQPGDLFQRFAKALTVLGNQMKLGAPLQDLLKKQGINWKKSEDGQAIIFFVQNAATKAPQPIARVGFQTLAKPQEFQKQLSAMLDFAKGQAPGTEQQKYDEAQEAMKNLRDIAQAMAPEDPSKQQNVMQTAMAGGDMGDMQMAASQPAQPKPEPKRDPAVGPITKSKPEALGKAANKAAGTGKPAAPARSMGK